MRIIQIVLIAIGVLIVAGFIHVGIEVARRITAPDSVTPDSAASTSAASTSATSAVKAADQPLTLPPGSQLGDPVTDGNGVYYRVVLPDGTQQLHRLNRHDGRVQVLVTAPITP